MLSIGQVRGWAIARLGISLNEFYLMRPGEFWEAILAWQADKEADRRHVAELIRGVGVRLFNIQLAPKDRYTDVRKFWPFPWDEVDDKSAEVERLNSMTEEERSKAAMEFLERNNLTDF